MPILRRCLLAFLLLIAAPATAQSDADWLYRGSDIPRDAGWRFGTLPNGLKYAVRQNKLPAGQVSIRLRIDAGSLHEADGERGWAHLTEHLVFRGTKSFADREARQLWQRLGASFGSDTNASTTPTQTVYQLDLPNADQAEIGQSLQVIADMADNALFAAEAVAGERKIVMEEKGRRPELTTRYLETSWPLFYAGLRIAERDPIGTDATLAAATPEALRTFYERWYRPERATLVIVGDADPAALEMMIVEHFAEWQGSGPAPAEPDYGSIAQTPSRTAALAYAGAPHTVSGMWLRPYRNEPDTKARERQDMARAIAARIVNRRLEARARGDAAYVNAGIGESRQAGIADTTQLGVTARGARWREALNEVFAILADARAAPPSPAEIAREISNLRTAYTSALQGADTIKSPQFAAQLIGAVDSDSVVASPRTMLALFEEFAPAMTPALIVQATRDLFAGAGPRLVLLSPAAIPAAEAGTALAAAERAAPAARQAEREVTFADLPALGAEGREISRERIADLGVTVVRFANGSSLTFKQTDFEKGSVSVQTRFGTGRAGLPPDRPNLAWLSGAVGPSGLAKLDLDGLERLLTGRKIGLSFSVDDDAFVLGARTNGTDLPDQLRLIATKLAYPRWDAQVVDRLRTGAIESYDLAFASAGGRAGREFAGFARPGDARWAPVEKNAIEAANAEAFERFFAPLLASGPPHVVMVGDVDLETAVAAMKRTIAALPVRPEPAIPPAHLQVRPPAPATQPTTFTHNGDADEAYAMIGWSTIGGTDRIKDRRALSLAANILQVRLFDSLRETEGASYSPSATSSTSADFPAWGIFHAASPLRPESVPTFFRIARETVADLAAKSVAADEFARAQNPVLSGIERTVKTNAYWLQVMAGWRRHPETIAHARSYRADYASMTAEDVRAAVAAHIADAPSWSMQVLPAKAPNGGD